MELTKLPSAEFEVMKVVWNNIPPITTSMMMDQLGYDRKWKNQTALTLFTRLVKRGFLRTEKDGKERLYYPLIDRDTYLEYESNDFLKRYHSDSVISLVSTLYQDKKMSQKDLDDLEKWLEEKKD